jgi:thiol-disulfide isomerase/thioredoxin
MRLRRTLPGTVTLLAAACSGQSHAEPDSPAFPEGSVEVALTAQVPETGSDRVIRWSPYGKQLPLTEVDGGMRGELPLGPQGTRPIGLFLSRSEGSPHFDQLLMEHGGNGEPEARMVFTTIPAERNNRYWSSFEAVVEIPVLDPFSGAPAKDPYPMSLWYVEDPRVPDEEPVLRFSRRGYMHGTAILDGVEAVVLVTERMMDGVYGPDDAWALASADSAGNALRAEHSRSVDEHAWLLDQAYRIVELHPSGRRVVLAPFDPGITREEEEEMKDDLRVDREAPRSGRTVAFLRDFYEAQLLADGERKNLFIDFETTWCGPCKLMDQWVYTADAVVEAAAPLVAVKVDGDEHPDLKERFGVTGFPTMILLSPDGEELRRVSGYVNVADMAKFLEDGS